MTTRRALLFLLLGLGALFSWWVTRSGDETWVRRAEVRALAPIVRDPGALGVVCLLDTAFAVQGGAVRTASVVLDGQERRALVGVGPFELTQRFTVPEGAWLFFGLNRDDGATPGPALTCRIEVSAKDRPLFETSLAPEATNETLTWQDHRLDLGDFAGREIELRLSVECVVTATTRTFWSELLVAPKSSPLPNVVVVLVDTLRADHLGCYGYERDTSPVIDALAAEGVRFRNAKTVAPWTDPSILALHSGLHPSDVWLPMPHAEAVREVVPDAVQTLAETLAGAGWFTVAASDHPGINSGRFGQGFDIFAHLYHVDGPYLGWRQTGGGKIRSQVRELIEPRPRGGLFLYLHLIYPHRPYRPPPGFATFGAGTYDIREENRDGLINLYDGEIRRSDQLIGQVLGDIERLGFGPDTIVVLVSDHGEAFWEHGFDEHGDTLYDELLAIPLIVHAPGRLEPRSVESVVSITDVFPTIVDLVGLPAPAGIRGRSLVPLAKGEELSERLLLSEFPHSRILHARALHSLDEKLIDEGEGGAVLYFDLASDPGELDDVADRAIERVTDLQRILELMPQTPRFQSRSVEPSTEMRDALEALGYGG